jgi:molybdopterin-synthase adenylyltransferase
MSTPELPPLTPDESSAYEWQMWVDGFGAEGQRKLKGASVLISRCGGLGGAAAYQLAAAGVGRLVLAHAGDVKPSDLNRQILMTHDWIGKPRMASIERRLKELNPRLEVEGVAENITPSNVERLVREVDVVVDAAPLFEERFLLNRESVRQAKPMVDAAVWGLEAYITTFVPGRTGCLACLYPEEPRDWRRQFPIFGAVAGTAGSLAAVEVIKLVSGIGEPLAGRLLVCDLRSMAFSTMTIRRSLECLVCSGKEN